MPAPNYAEALAQMRTHDGRLVQAISRKKPVLIVFLRHFGCTFCREALSDLSKRMHEIDNLGGELVMVHMSTPEIAEKYFAKYNLGGVTHVADPTCRFYQGFGLTKGTARQLFGLHSWIRGFQAGVIDGHGIGKELGDGFQMPGVFVVVNGSVRNQFVHKLAGERPEYVDLLAQCCEVNT